MVGEMRAPSDQEVDPQNHISKTLGASVQLIEIINLSSLQTMGRSGAHTINVRGGAVARAIILRERSYILCHVTLGPNAHSPGGCRNCWGLTGCEAWSTRFRLCAAVDSLAAAAVPATNAG